MRGLDPDERLIVALDVPRLEAGLAFVERMGGAVRWVKVGLQLFAAEGPQAVCRLKERGLKVFLDLKLHDIPTTVGRALEAIRGTGADMVNVHALGGAPMIAAAARALAGEGTVLLAVTVLTSHDETSLRQIGVAGPVTERVLALASLAKAAGAGGVVASGEEVTALRGRLGEGFRIVVPGVRQPKDGADDQARPTTVTSALRAGADQVVLGRALSAAPDPRERFRQFVREAEVV